jgi:outer membrane protein OmpA-like peptidoglycan-associated protein
VNDYLVAQGIPQTRMNYKGYGLTKPMYSIDTETGRDGNRKTEFKIIKINK